jgi:hypothetical protein
MKKLKKVKKNMCLELILIRIGRIRIRQNDADLTPSGSISPNTVEKYLICQLFVSNLLSFACRYYTLVCHILWYRDDTVQT